MEKLNNNPLKTFEGQSWSSWTNSIGHIIPPEQKDDFNEPNAVITTDTHAMKLSKEDMGIFGHCPTDELFELAICNYCGDKFKIPALADHIRLRHENEKCVPLKFLKSHAKKYSSLLLKNNKGKHSKQNSKKKKIKAPIAESDTLTEKSDLPIDDEVVLRESVLTMTIIKNTPDLLRSDSSHIEKVEDDKTKHLKVNLKNSDVFDKPTVTLPQINKKVKSSNISFVASPDTKKKRIKNDSNSCSSVKEVNGKPDGSSSPQESTIVVQENEHLPNMQPVMQLSPIVDLGRNSFIDQSKKLKNNKKPTSIRGRTYDPDKHCGVLSGTEIIKPCTRSLTCKSHSKTLKRLVNGRSKYFDILLENHRTETALLKKNKLLQTGTDNKRSTNKKIKTLNRNDQMVQFSPKNQDKSIQLEVIRIGDHAKEIIKKVPYECVTLESCDGYVQMHPCLPPEGLLMTSNCGPNIENRAYSVNLSNARKFNDSRNSGSFGGQTIVLTNNIVCDESSSSEMTIANLLIPLSDNSVNNLRQPVKMEIAQVPPVEPELTRKLQKNKRAQNVPTNLIRPVVTPNVSITPVVDLAYATNHIQNQILNTQEQTTTLITNSPFQNILQSESLGHPGIHYITSPGPFSIPLQQQPTIFQQVHLNDHFHLHPIITPAGIVYIKSTPNN